MGVIDGYTWEVERWSPEGERWEAVERQQEVASIAQVRARVAELYADGEENRPLSVRSRELRAQHGSRDQTLDAILDHIQAQETRIDRLTNDLATTSADLEQTRLALLSVARKITPARGARISTPAVAFDASATGPVISPTPSAGPDVHR